MKPEVTIRPITSLSYSSVKFYKAEEIRERSLISFLHEHSSPSAQLPYFK